MRKLTIDRATWARGGEPNTSLFDPDNGRKCCLGFYLLNEGLSEADLTKVGEPCDVIGIVQDWDTGLAYDDDYDDYGYNTILNTEVARCLMDINDNDLIDDHHREQRIAEVMREKLDCEVTFV